MTLTINPELKSLIPPLMPTEYAGLEQSIKTEGCRDPIVTWNGVIIDGHNRYEICTRNNIPYNTTGMAFQSMDDVKIWMFKNQISRRNLNAFQRAELSLWAEPLITAAVKAKEHDRKTTSQNSVESIDTQKEIAKIAQVSHDTVYRVKVITEKAPETVITKLRAGSLTINAVYNEIKKGEVYAARREELTRLAKTAADNPMVTLYHGDFLKDYTKIPAGSIDCIITDPPYVHEWIHNFDAFGKAAKHVLKPDGFLIMYIGHIHLDVVMEQLKPHLTYHWIMALEHSGSRAAVHGRMVQCLMKPILVYSNSPQAQPKRYFGDLIKGEGREKGAHPWQQGEGELKGIFDPFTDPNDLILDPFMGSGTVLAMAKKMGRRAIGFDIDAANVEVTKGRLSEEVTQ
jgi:16S rRNA G966 N2-methylase RsmD